MQIPDESKKAGYDPGQKTFFLWEGVTMYISAEAVDSTLQFIATGSAPGSSVVFDYMPLGAVQNDFERYPDIRRLSFWVAYRGGTACIRHQRRRQRLLPSRVFKVDSAAQATPGQPHRCKSRRDSEPRRQLCRRSTLLQSLGNAGSGFLRISRKGTKMIQLLLFRELNPPRRKRRGMRPLSRFNRFNWSCLRQPPACGEPMC